MVGERCLRDQRGPLSRDSVKVTSTSPEGETPRQVSSLLTTPSNGGKDTLPEGVRIHQTLPTPSSLHTTQNHKVQIVDRETYLLLVVLHGTNLFVRLTPCRRLCVACRVLCDRFRTRSNT